MNDVKATFMGIMQCFHYTLESNSLSAKIISWTESMCSGVVTEIDFRERCSSITFDIPLLNSATDFNGDYLKFLSYTL